MKVNKICGIAKIRISAHLTGVILKRKQYCWYNNCFKLYMRKVLYILLCFVVSQSTAQYLHTPEEMSRIMNQSQLSYIIDTLDQTKSNTIFPLMEKGWWAIATPEGIELEMREEVRGGKLAQLYKKGQKFYKKSKYLKAISFCEKAHNLAPSDIEIIKRIGRSYDAIKKVEVAGTWYQKALELNPIDFEAHYLLAEVYAHTNDKELAIYHSTMAHVLNRNHPELFKSFKAIYQQFGVNYHAWDFTPDYNLTKVDPNNIKVSSEKLPWVAYANCKAIWEYEPGYREKMQTLSNAPSSITEEKECLLNVLIAYEKMSGDKSSFPELTTLSFVVPDRMVDYFILYEIESRRTPTIISQLPEKKIKKLIEYVSSYRAK